MQASETLWQVRFSALRAYVAAVILVGVAIAAAFVLRRLPHANLSLLFLLAVLTVAAVWGLRPSIFASVLSFLALNFLFTIPLYSFTVEEEGDLASIVFFLAMAALTANLAARMRTEMAESRSALSRVSTLLDFSGEMSSAVSTDDALAALADAIAGALGRNILVWRQDESGRLILPDAIAERSSSTTDDDAADIWASGSDQLQVRDGRTYIPLKAADTRVGLVAVHGGPLDSEQQQFADGLCEQASLAVTRIVLDENLKAAQLVSQTEQLRSALLSSVSHDLRTPLASIIGSVSSVLEYRDILNPNDQRELLQTVLEESQRLNRYIQNLLDMTRFGQHQIELQREWVDLNDLVSGATERLGPVLNQFVLSIDISRNVSLIHLHGALIEQALVNILDNALGFSEPGDAIGIRSYLDGDATVIDVFDRGPGIPEEQREKVFDMFYTAAQGDNRRYGVGLGLAICRSIVEAHSGTIDALAGPEGRGTRVRIRLPVAENPIGESDA